MNPYEILGLTPGTTTKAAVNRAFKERLTSAHPDKGGTNEQMTQLNQARDILLNPVRRRRFDEIGSTESGQLSIEEQAQMILSTLFGNALIEAPEDISIAELLVGIVKAVADGLQKAKHSQRTHPRRLARARAVYAQVTSCDPRLRKAFELRLAKLETEGAELNQQVEVGNLMLRLMKSVRFGDIY